MNTKRVLCEACSKKIEITYEQWLRVCKELDHCYCKKHQPKNNNIDLEMEKELQAVADESKYQ